MYGENPNFKDTNSAEKSMLSLKDSESILSYRKTNKLVTALFMVTEIIESSEPLRLKLRTSGLEVLSDVAFLSEETTSHKTSMSVIRNVQEILYLLDIAEAINLISKMNASILTKEFLALKSSIEQALQMREGIRDGSRLLTLLANEKFSITPPIKNNNSIGHLNSTRIGVQKASTLMQVLSDRVINKTHPAKEAVNKNKNSILKDDFNTIKGQRRSEILDIIKIKGTPTIGVSILDIKNSLKGHLSSSSEKTLQRELVSMVEDGLLRKTGSKRWSRYFSK